MTWLVFAVSCLLVLAGAISIITGAPYIQLERGWTEVIAGTMALSSGGVVFALAAILLRLEGLRETLAAKTTVEASVVPLAAPLAIEPAPAAVSQAQDEAPAEPPSSAPAVDDHVQDVKLADGTLERHGLWKRVRRTDDAVQKPETPASVASIDVVERPDPAPPLAERSVVPPSTSLAPAMPIPEPASVPAVLPAEPAESPAAEGETLGWLDRSLLRPRPKPMPLAFDLGQSTDKPEMHGAIEPPMRREPILDPGPSVSLESQPETEPAVAHPEDEHSTTAHEPTVEPDAEEVTVIGRYQAGVASYVMYSDGTIEVETEGGELHRFASMDELKTFIAQQDSPVA